MKTGLDLGAIGTLFQVGTVGGASDGQLLERFLAGRDRGAESAFAGLVALHGPMVWRVCRTILADSHAAEDAFQATFLILAQRAASIRKRDRVGPWLHGVARRVALRAKPETTARRRGGDEIPSIARPDIPDPARREQLEALHQEIRRLAEKYRAAVILCDLENRTHIEAARLLNCPVGTVSVRVARARELLRARLTRRGLAPAAALAGSMLGIETADAAMARELATSTTRLVMGLVGGTLKTGTLPAAIAKLTQGGIGTVNASKLIVASGVLAVGIGSTSGGWLAADQKPDQGQPNPAPAATSPARRALDSAAPAKKTERPRGNQFPAVPTERIAVIKTLEEWKYPDSQILQGASQEDKENPDVTDIQSTAIWTTPDPVEKVSKFYSDKFPKVTVINGGHADEVTRLGDFVQNDSQKRPVTVRIFQSHRAGIAFTIVVTRAEGETLTHIAASHFRCSRLINE
jgi:RNA polymerase sigma factor (sigma-70 family)